AAAGAPPARVVLRARESREPQRPPPPRLLLLQPSRHIILVPARTHMSDPPVTLQPRPCHRASPPPGLLPVRRRHRLVPPREQVIQAQLRRGETRRHPADTHTPDVPALGGLEEVTALTAALQVEAVGGAVLLNPGPDIRAVIL